MGENVFVNDLKYRGLRNLHSYTSLIIYEEEKNLW